MPVSFRKEVESIPVMPEGKSLIEQIRQAGFDDAYRLGSNESPLGPFPQVVESLAKWIQEVNRYPEMDCRELLYALSESLDISRDKLLIGSGSAEILFKTAMTLLEPGDEVIFPWPTFGYLDNVSRLVGAVSKRVPLVEGFHHHLEAIHAAIGPKTKVIYLCNPNNPTGTYIPFKDFCSFMDAVPNNVLVLSDEAYLEFATAEDCGTMMPMVDKYDNLLVTKTFSKIYSIAGLRVGYAIAHPTLAAPIRKARGAYPVSLIGQWAAIECLKHPDLVAERRALNAHWREALCAGIQEHGYPVISSQTNFIATQLGGSSNELYQEFLKRGVVIRQGMGLEDGWIRITVGLPNQNEKFLAALREIRPKR